MTATILDQPMAPFQATQRHLQAAKLLETVAKKRP
jgi:hypothetical protein